jgi:RNase H-like domain found in reverse transcriptase
MRHPDHDKAFHVYFDASLRGIGGLLVQDFDGLMYPVAFCARRMQPAEVNYITTEHEFLAMVYCFNTWRCYLEGPFFYAHTDYEPLTWLASQTRLGRRQARWMEFLSRFEYSLLYVQGDKNVCADALSRMLSLPDDPMDLPGESWPHTPAAEPNDPRVRRALHSPVSAAGHAASASVGTSRGASATTADDSCPPPSPSVAAGARVPISQSMHNCCGRTSALKTSGVCNCYNVGAHSANAQGRRPSITAADTSKSGQAWALFARHTSMLWPWLCMHAPAGVARILNSPQQ